NTSWRPQSCQECTCYSDVSICRPIHCPNPQCNVQRGEFLRIPANKCCPECVASSQDSCQYEGVTYGHGSQWSPSPCSVCFCSRGNVSCHTRPCPDLTCPGDQNPFIPTGECCPKCGGNGESCSWQGVVYRDGEEWEPGMCSRCVCSSGKARCSVVECQQVACRPHENLVIQPGRCCPQCMSNPCLSAGTQYQHGEQWQKDACTTCVCHRGQSKCRTNTCQPVVCDKGLTKVRRVGRCCEECAPAKGSCLFQDAVRYHGDMWNGTGCEFCTCNRGQVLCRRAECGRVDCPEVKLAHLPGKCCPECSSAKPSCLYEGKSYKVLLLTRWTDGSCRECECRDAQVTCYLRSCPSCPPGTLAVIKEGQCCPECQQAQCHADCLSCLGTPDRCESCRDPKAFLHLGRCLPFCPGGYYAEGRVCAACPESCATCSSRWDCQSCDSQLPLLGPDRDRCLGSCPPGSYQHDHTLCCHRSCSECRGPTQQECLSCSDPAALLKDGLCVSDCGAGYYNQEGICYACDPSCASCFPDNPKCMSCPAGTALHHGKCIAQCPTRHYVDNHSRCRDCHSSCASCWGPSVSQCISCPSGLLLHQGQCVEACGEGLYPQDSTCHNCHPSCRSCVGPLASDCLRCLKPEEVLQPQYMHLQRGVCTAGCPEHSFLDDLQTCRDCHPSCQRCTGPSAENCSSCSSPSSLFEGRCVPTCPQGFFTRDNQCQACHPSCQACSGPSQADCTSCAPQVSLQSGYCTTGCQEGRFLSAVTGECLKCSPDCQRCAADLQTGVGSVCLWCKAARTWLLGDHCVSHCPSGHYAWHGACIRCHPSCESCSGAGHSSCTSCPPNAVLLPSGLCAPKCPVGYHDNGLRICQACDRQCLTCDTAGVCTSCRDPTKVLLFGECQYDSCAHQYYLNATTRTCRECDWSCNACKGPLRTDCLQCMEGYVLQDGVCTQGCSLGFYQDGDTCLGCDDHCVKCSSPGKCVECQPPYAALQGHCVLDCGRNYFLDGSSKVCKSCSSDCLHCDGVGRCLVCRDETFLMKGYCTPDCGHGFYADQKTRTCHVNHHTPVLHINGSLMVPIGGSAPLLPSLLEVRDPDSPSERMVFQLVQEPNNGRLVLLTEEEAGENGEKRSKELNREDTITWAQLELGRVRFTHLKNKARTGQFSLRVADPQMFSQPATVHVQAVSMQPPRVLTLAPLTLEGRGSLATITKSVLHVDDPDNPADVLVMVLEAPRHGRLTRLHGGRALGRFKLEELWREQIQYVHDGSAAEEDSVVLQLNDGHSYRNVLLQVRLDSPQLVSLPMTWVKEGGMVRLNKKHLQTDFKGVSADDIVYTILASDGQPKYGEVVLVSMPADGPPEGWDPSLIDDQRFTSTASFTQQDVNDGTVWYHHFGSSYDSDSFQFQHHRSSTTFTVGSRSALEDQVTEITPSALSFIDSGTPSEKLIYNITKPLLPGQGVIEHRDKPHKAVKRFTQADVNAGKIIYRPPPAPSHLQELHQYSFTGLPESLSVYFTVSDGEHTTPELDFVILLLSNHQQPPVFQVLDPLLEVSMGGRATLGGQQLAVSDADTAPDDLEFELVDAPVHGELLRTDDNMRMSNGDTFTFSDVTRKVLLYRHAGLSTQDDAMSFSVSDGISMASTVVQVTVLGEAGEAPRRDPAATLSLEVGEKSSTVIRRSHLAYTDNASPDDQIHIQLVSVPMYGLLTRTLSQQEPQELREYSSFTQEDVNLHRIRYVTSLDTGSQPVTDVFHFVVHDGDSNRLDNQMCTITITSVPRQPPVVTVRGGIKVQEGGRVLLSSNHITVSDVETPSTDLQVWLVSPPKYGFIENTNRVGGSRIVTPAAPFSVEDLVSDHIFYVQDSQRQPEASQDVFSFYISDGYSQTEAFTVEINIQLTVSVSSIHVEENSGVVITNSSLSVYDEDTPESEIIFTIVRIPSYGKLRRRQFYSQPLENGRILTQGSTFTYQDVLDRLLVYTPETVSGGSDEMGFTLTDGIQTHTGLLQFTMDVRKSEGPRMTVNRGLQLPAGSSSKITEQNLKGSDIDSDSLKLRYILTKDPPAGKLQLSRSQNVEKVSVKGPVQSFTQQDVNKGACLFPPSCSAGLITFSNSANISNTCEDHLPPSVEVNKGLVLDENSVKKLTTLQLSSSDQDSEPGELIYRITKQTSLGQLEHVTNPGTRINSFTQADLASRSIQYVHTSEEEKHADQFSFTVSDGTNEGVYIYIYIYIHTLADQTNNTIGVIKTITNYKQRSTAEYIIFTVVQPPRHGTVERTSNGQHYRQTSTFTMDDVYQNRISYNHDGSNSLKDRFTFTVADGTNVFFMVEEENKEVDDGVFLLPLLFNVHQATNLITKKELLTMDPDTDDGQLVYEITAEPKHGFLETKLNPGNPVTTFTQADVNLGLIRYVLHQENIQETMDNFKFLVKDSKPNVVSDNVFHIQWSLISFEHKSYNVSEKAGTVAVTVKRTGNLNQYAIVLCRTEQGTAVSTSSTGTSPGQQDYVEYAGQVPFWKKPLTDISIKTRGVKHTARGPDPARHIYLCSAKTTKNFFIHLSVPTMQFEKTSYTVKERDTVLHVPVIRTGDLSFKSSVRCFTRTLSAMVMDDFVERRNADESRITFLKGEKVKNCTVHVHDDSVFEPEEDFQLHLGAPQGDHWSGAMIGANDVVAVTITNDEDAPTIEFEQASYQVREPPGPDGVEALNIKVIRRGDLDRTSKIRCSTRDGSAQSGVDYNPKSRVLKFTPGMDHIVFTVEILSNEDREWHESFSLVLGPDDPVEAVLGDITTATVTILDQEAAGSLILPAPPMVVSLADYDHVQEVTKEGSRKTPSPGYPLVCVTPCDPHYPKHSVMKEHCAEAGINQTQVHFSWEVAAPTDSSGARSPFETVTDTTPYTSVNHMVLDSIYFSRRFHVRCVAQARDKAGHLGTPLRSNVVTIGTDGSICHTPVTTGTARGFQAQSFIASLKYLDVKHKEHPNRIHISVQIPHQDGMLPLVSTMPLHNLHFLLSESIYRQQHVCSNLVTIKELQGLSESGFLDDVSYDSISLGPGYDRPYQFNPGVREAKSIQLYKHLNLKSCIWTFDAYYDMTELIDVCGGSVTADFQVRDSAQSFLTVQVPLYVSYIYVTAPRGWASLEHHTEMEFSFFYDTVLWRTGIQTDSVLSARLQIIRIFIREDGRLVIEFKTHAKFRGQFVLDHHTLPGHKSRLMAPDHLGGIEFDMQLLWSAQTFDSPYQLWRATSSYSRKDYSGEYTVLLIPCTVQPTQPWIDPGDKPLSCTAHAPEKFLVPIAFQQTNRPVPVVYSLNTEFQLCNNEKVFLLDPASADVAMAEMDYKGAFSMGQTLYGRVLWNPEQNLNAAYKLQLEKVYLCTGRDGYVPFFDPTGTLYNEGPQYGCIQPNKHLKHRFLLLDRKQPDVCDNFFHDVPFEADFASDVPELQAMAAMPGVDGFTMKVDALYKVEAGHQWYLQVIYVISPESRSSPRIQRSVTYHVSRSRRDLVDRSGRLMLDESLIYDNEGDQVKNGTNMKSLRLEVGQSATFNAHVGSSVGGGVAAVTLLVLALLASCFLFRRCKRSAKKTAKVPKAYEEYPLNTKVEVCMDKCVEKNFSSKHCTVRNVNINRNQEPNGKVKQVNLEVKLHNNLNDGTEV
uniref:Fraser extracellular matrix complex subunit 1 n=1 Tax=Fundulus heteroclitus TaxID=8078 RepID=A0A3Q2PFS0_FUNHE